MKNASFADANVVVWLCHQAGITLTIIIVRRTASHRIYQNLIKLIELKQPIGESAIFTIMDKQQKTDGRLKLTKGELFTGDRAMYF